MICLRFRKFFCSVWWIVWLRIGRRVPNIWVKYFLILSVVVKWHYNIGEIEFCLRALEEQSFGLSSLHLVVQDLIIRWANFFFSWGDWANMEFWKVKRHFSVAWITVLEVLCQLFIFALYLFQPQAKGSYVTGDVSFSSTFDMFHAIKQDAQQCFILSRPNRQGQWFFLHGHLASLLYCLVRRIVSKAYLPSERYWEDIHEFDFLEWGELSCAILFCEWPRFPMMRIERSERRTVEPMLWHLLLQTRRWTLFGVSSQLSELCLQWDPGT